MSPDVAYAAERAIAQITFPTLLFLPAPSLLRLQHSRVDANCRGAFKLDLRNTRRQISNRLAPGRLGVGLTSSAGSGNQRQLSTTKNRGREWYRHRGLANRPSAGLWRPEIVRGIWFSVRREVEDWLRISSIAIEE
jgi:hypothetical protein